MQGLTGNILCTGRDFLSFSKMMILVGLIFASYWLLEATNVLQRSKNVLSASWKINNKGTDRF
jgi:hypothetical protein